MSKYRNLIISYDLRNKRDYAPLIKCIEGFLEFEKILESVYWVRTARTAVEAREILKAYIDGDDGIAVFDCTGNTWATIRAISVEKMKEGWVSR